MNILKRILNKIYIILIKGQYKNIGKNVRIYPKSIVLGKKKVEIGSLSIIHDYAIIDSSNKEDIGVIIEENVIIHEFCYIKAFDGLIKIGSNSTINQFCVIHGCSGGVIIGKGVRIASGCSLVANSHIFKNPDIFIYEQGVTSKGIVIEDDVWLGSGTKIIDGVKIGKGCVIGANSVVTKDVPPYSVAVGVPAKVINSRITF